ncbi:MAG TPA: MucB/RseB C-terminal domain-containing protein [Acidiferrobacteraceae bacterium]|nr:MucB/RseB C-terminal domain-containing protein [Acidiferrobacteraceae bacterium]
MRGRLLQSGLALGLCLGGVPLAEAALSARGWLMRMDAAGHSVNYIGTFVYHHGSMLETMRIFHRVGASGVRERLESLNGTRREIIRGPHRIRCYLPHENALIVERSRSGRKGFPAVLPTHLRRLDRYYRFALGGTARVAGRAAQIILIGARDRFRYGYRLWADQKTGLLLRSDLLSPAGAVVEQFMFTRIHPGVPVSAAAVQPPPSLRPRQWHHEAPATAPVPGPQWRAENVPPGFHLEKRLLGFRGPGNVEVQHFVYSDGLAAVSVFVQKVRGQRHQSMVGLQQMGAVHVYGRMDDGYRITVMGEVPMATVNRIGSSLMLAGTGSSH